MPTYLNRPNALKSRPCWNTARMPSRSYASSTGYQYGSSFNTRWRFWRAKSVWQVLLAISASTSSNMWLTRQTRSTALPLLTIPRTNTEFARRSYSYSAPFIWNSLPGDVFNCNSEHTFKKHLKTFLFNSCFYEAWLTPPLAPLYLCVWRFTNLNIIIIIIWTTWPCEMTADKQWECSERLDNKL